jgi:hypothetical protein
MLHSDSHPFLPADTLRVDNPFRCFLDSGRSIFVQSLERLHRRLPTKATRSRLQLSKEVMAVIICYEHEGGDVFQYAFLLIEGEI